MTLDNARKLVQLLEKKKDIEFIVENCGRNIDEIRVSTARNFNEIGIDIYSINKPEIKEIINALLNYYKNRLSDLESEIERLQKQ